MPDQGDPHFGLVMPFVVCQSQGGPFEDQAFVSGYRLGEVNAILEHAKPRRHALWARPEDVPQLDLIAMRHGYGLTTEPWDEYPEEHVECVLLRSGFIDDGPSDTDEIERRP